MIMGTYFQIWIYKEWSVCVAFVVDVDAVGEDAVSVESSKFLPYLIN